MTLVANGEPWNAMSMRPENVLPENVPDDMRQVMSGLQPDCPVPVSELDANTYANATLPPLGVVMSTLNPSAFHVFGPAP
jgi:hypothetical protein